MEASYHVNRTILNIFQHCILGGVIVTQELDSQLWIHLPHAHVTMTEQHMLGLEIGFLSLWLGVWYEYPLLVKHYVSSAAWGCSEVAASYSSWENLSPSTENASLFLQSVGKLCKACFGLFHWGWFVRRTYLLLPTAWGVNLLVLISQALWFFLLFRFSAAYFCASLFLSQVVRGKYLVRNTCRLL